MPFLVFENDDFVRSDLLQLLASAFPTEPIVPHDILSELADTVREADPAFMFVALVHASVQEVRELRDMLGATAERCRIILLNDGPPEQDEADSGAAGMERDLTSFRPPGGCGRGRRRRRRSSPLHRVPPPGRCSCWFWRPRDGG